MLKGFLSSFVRGYGRSLGREAARQTRWLALPVLLLVVVLAVMEFTGNGGQVARMVPSFLSGASRMIGR